MKLLGFFHGFRESFTAIIPNAVSNKSVNTITQSLLHAQHIVHKIAMLDAALDIRFCEHVMVWFTFVTSTVTLSS